MTVPGVRVTPVRRTVLVAVALVTGQALLCAIIGFVTFGTKEAAVSSADAAGPRPAAPPAVVPPTSIPSPGRSAGSKKHAATRSTTIRPTSPAPRSPAVRRSPTRPVAPPSTGIVPVVPVVPVPPVPSISLLPPVGLFPTPSAERDVPKAPVDAYAPCDDEGATGETADGQAVRCLRDRAGELRWRLV